jgi:hypothetical protein
VSSASRRADFFALEANEYLTELAPLAAAHDRPDAERLLRGARALRGAALMAGLGTYARAAAGLEAIARQVRDHALPWEPHARDAWIAGLDALRALVSRASEWQAADDRQALQLVEQFEQVMHGRPARSTPVAPPTLTPGVRAFIARESALIAGSLERASHALAPTPPTAALAGVLERMQSLRGLGASSELSPLPELLDAMEVATRTLLGDFPAPPDVAAVFAEAAAALASMGQMVADAGRVEAPTELEAIAQRLLQCYASEHDVVAIASLAPDGVDAIVHAGTPPSQLPPGDPVPVELVSVGDHLLAAADGFARSPTPAARALRLFVLYRTLSAMPARSATGQFLTPLAETIAAAISNQVATQRPDAFIAMLRGCGRFLVDAGGMHDRIALTNRRDAIVTSLIMVSAGAPAGGFDLTTPAESRQPRLAPPAPEPVTPVAVAAHHDDTANTTPIVAIESLAPDEPADVVVDIASLAPDEPDNEVVDIASLAPDEPDNEVVDIAAFAPDEPDHDIVDIASLAPDDAASPVVPVELLAPAAAPLIPVDAPGEPSRLESAFGRRRTLRQQRAGDVVSLAGLIGTEIVPIATLIYRGSAALVRADEVRVEIRDLLRDGTTTLDALRPHINELLDLVPLARDAA